MKRKASMEMFEHKCKRPNCGHKWLSLMARPVVCPKCKSYSWDEAKKK
jgi:hypothetical protein